MIPLLRKLSISLATVCIGLASQAAAAQDAGCINYSSSDIRTFQIKQIIKVGMKAADVQRVWGEPTKIRQRYPGGDEWEYWNPAGDQVVTFGQHGCVTGWYIARE
ncbi:hypothetical protein HG264_04330 [Pseudomonas sp. gcc21]|uniref:hypothetical protein n=1 Tax=Pseudomonas sp. gcc21 TaxID=2726989 RepID=UPI001451B640|nr:hypothetical protein [Pseudomonas sp. gcc21]QJD58197.1 hypothetical protein HG264_04330 [Pseudomonas sp. gcc21]